MSNVKGTEKSQEQGQEVKTAYVANEVKGFSRHPNLACLGGKKVEVVGFYKSPKGTGAHIKTQNGREEQILMKFLCSSDSELVELGATLSL